MKVSFFGNCQLENVANLIHTLCREHHLDIEILWHKAVYQTKPEEYMNVILALESSDIIYTQYHDKPWGIYATENLRKLYELRIVPTLESFVSTPQTGEWHVMPDLAAMNVHYCDFRILDLYLRDTPVDEVVPRYFSIAPKTGAIEKEIQRMTDKYRTYYHEGKVILDYSDVYAAALQENLHAFHTYNHPANKQLEWMLNGIMADMGMPTTISLDGPEILSQFQMPSLVSEAKREQYVISGHALPFPLVPKIFYAYFNAIDRDLLTAAFQKSPYFALMEM